MSGRRGRAALLALVLAAGSLLPAEAQEVDPQARALAVELLEATNAEAMAGQMASLVLEASLAPMRERFAAAGSCPAANARIDTQLVDLRTLLTDAFRDGDFVGRAAEIYARNFSADELRAAVRFFGSDAGRKFVDRQPELMQAGAVLGQSMMAPKQAQIEAMGREFAGELRVALDGCKGGTR